jgi:hypothetical protein
MYDGEGIEEEYSMDADDFEDFEEPSPAPIPGPNVPLKGRKRFLADLEEMKKMCAIGFGSHGLDLSSKCKGYRYPSERPAMLNGMYLSDYLSN